MASRAADNPSTILGPSLAALSKSFIATQSDKETPLVQLFLYPKRVWYCVGSFIGFVSLCHFLSLVYRISIRRNVPPPVISRQRGVIDYRRVPVAVMHTFRALAFRSTVSIGQYYTLNVADLFMTLAYTAILFSWSLVNCKS
jgi:ferric-chelate reductase